MTKAEKIRSYTPNIKSNKIRTGATTTSTQQVRTGALMTGNQKVRAGAKPKTTGITQTVGEVIKTNYSVGAPQMIAPVQTGNNNNGGNLEKSGKGGGYKEMLKNPVYYAVGIVMIVALFIAFKK